MDDDPDLARAFIADKRNLIQPRHRHRLDQMQAAADANREAQTRAQQIWDRSDGDPARALSVAANG